MKRRGGERGKSPTFENDPSKCSKKNTTKPKKNACSSPLSPGWMAHLTGQATRSVPPPQRLPKPSPPLKPCKPRCGPASSSAVASRRCGCGSSGPSATARSSCSRHCAARRCRASSVSGGGGYDTAGEKTKTPKKSKTSLLFCSGSGQGKGQKKSCRTIFRNLGT